MQLKLNYEIQKEATEKIKEIVKKMNGLSEEGFVNKFYRDPYFRKGIDTLVELLIQAKSEDGKDEQR